MIADIAQTHQFSIGLCFVLGSLHALEPGHGKSALAVRILSIRGLREPAAAALATAVSHSISILIVASIVHGALDLSYQEEHGLGFYRSLNIASGIFLILLATWFAYARRTNRSTHVHRGNCCGQTGANETALKITIRLPNSRRKKDETVKTVLLGFAVGLIPCPTALVALSQALVAKDWLSVVTVTAVFALGIFSSLFVVGSVLNFGTLIAEPVRGFRHW